VDRHIAEVAARGGVYGLADHRGGGGEARSAVARLRELERLGLVTPRSPDVWNVPPDLLERLELQHREQPARFHLAVQPAPLSLDDQVRHQGPVWLDSVEPTTLARQGFGAEVVVALERRQQALHALGIRADDPERLTKLRELEERTVGRRIERETGRTFLETPPSGFRGRVQPMPQGDAPYLAISDGQRFVLVPATREARGYVGRDVEVARDESGRPLVRTPSPAPDRQELARRAAGEARARATGRTFLETVPAHFGGHVQPGPRGSPYLEVSDGRQFILIPASIETVALTGKAVDVSRDAQGRFLGLRPRDRDHDRGR
jgi:hypothetical protein